MTTIAKPRVKTVKPPVPKYHYKLATVKGSQAASRMETALRNRLSETGMSFFSIGHESGAYDVIGDSGVNALNDDRLHDAKALAAQFSKQG